MHIILIFIISLISNSALAYIGPGLGIGLVASIIGLIFSILLFFFAILWFPIRKIFKKNKKNNTTNKK